MAKAKTNAAGSPPAYVERLNRVSALQREYREFLQIAWANIHERTRILVDVFEDPDYREKCRAIAKGGAVDDFQIAESLNGWVAETGFTFLVLRAILAVFPEVEPWSDRGPAALLVETREARHQRKKAAEPATPRHRPSKREFVAVRDRAERLEAEVKAAEEKTNLATETVQSLRERVRALEAERDAALARVEVLEEENAQLRAALIRPHGVLVA